MKEFSERCKTVCDAAAYLRFDTPESKHYADFCVVKAVTSDGELQEGVHDAYNSLMKEVVYHLALEISNADNYAKPLMSELFKH